MLKMNKQRIRSSISKASKPTSGVLAAKVVTHPPRQENDFTPTSFHADNPTEDIPLKNQQENISDIAAANKNLTEDSEFLLQASLFLQTAEQQLNDIESSLKRPKYPRKTFSLNIENCDRRDYAHQVVEAVLHGHDLKRKETFSVPARLQKNILSKKGESLSMNRDPADRPKDENIVIKEAKQISSARKDTDTNEKCNFATKHTRKKESNLYTDSFLQPSQVHENSVAKHNVPTKEIISEDFVAKSNDENPFIDETKKKFRNSTPVGLIRKKTTINNFQVSENDPKECPKNTALINMLSSFPTSDKEKEDDACLQSKLSKNSLTIQALPSINIKPELTQETFTHVNIPPSKNSLKESSANKNVSFIEIVFNEKDVGKRTDCQESPKRRKHKTIEPKRKSSPNYRKMVQIVKPSDSSSTEYLANSENSFNHKKEPLSVRKQKQFDRRKLDGILNAIIEKLVMHIEIPDEILESTIDRLWVLGDYLEEVYINSTEGYRQKVRLNFTSLWLHEIIRLIDNEIKNRCRSLNLSSGISTIVQYIISEIQCASSVSQRQSCILAEENGEIRFYCRHDSLIDEVRKSRRENRASKFLQSLNPSKIFSDGITSSVSNNNLENSITSFASESLIRKHSHVKSIHSNIENAEPNLIPRISLPSSSSHDIVSTNLSKLTGNQRKSKDKEISKNLVFENFAPEKLTSAKIDDADFKKEKRASKHTLSIYGKNKLMNADQRQKVIKKLGEEVQKMLNMHEQWRLPDHLDNSCASNVEDSKTNFITSNAPSNEVSQVLPVSSKIKVAAVESGKETGSSDINVDFQSSLKAVDHEPDLVPDDKNSNQVEKVSSINSSEDVAYEDDWEEECNISAKNENNEQSFANEGNNADFKFSGQEASKLISVEAERNNQDESKRPVAVALGKSEDTSVSSFKKSQVSLENSDIANEISINASEKKSLDLGFSLENNQDRSDLKSSFESKSTSESVAKHCSKPSDDPLAKNRSNKNASSALDSETDVVSDFSDQEVASVNSLSDNAQNSNSDLKKSGVNSEAETVKDLSVLTSEVVDTDSKLTMSLLIQENSFRENDSENRKYCNTAKFSTSSEYESMFSNKSLEVNECRVLNHNLVSNRDKNSEVSLKLSRSCNELAEKVLRIEQMKNDLLKVFIKPENESLNKVSSIQSLPETLREKEELMKCSQSSPFVLKSDVKNSKSSKLDSASDASVSLTQDNVMNDIDSSTNLHQTVSRESDCDSSNQSYIILYETKANFESESSSSEKLHLVQGNLMTSKPISNESSPEDLSDSEISIKSPTEVVLNSDHSQPEILTSRNISGESLSSLPKQISNEENTRSELVSESGNENENYSASYFDGDARTKGNSVAKSFVELSNEILNHLKQEAELLAQLDSTTSTHKTSAETDEFEISAKQEASSAECNGSKKNSSPFDRESDVINISQLSSDVSLLDFEHLMSELSENIDSNSDDLSGDSIDEIFSIISSERYKLDSSKNLDSSIKDVLYSANDDRNNFVIEHF